jgi:opacity protein-like surface antigen
MWGFMIRAFGGTMFRILAAALMALGLGSAAWAQDALVKDVRIDDPLFEAEAAKILMGPEFGVQAGYIKARDADDGTWFGGVQLRIPLASSLAIEGSIAVHHNEFGDGDIDVVQYPVQVSALFFLFPESPVCPYLLGGVGWYYTRVSFDDEVLNAEDDTTHFFGGHLGFGVRFAIEKSVVLSADFRYLFVEPNEDELEDENFDSTQFVFSIGFPF